MLPVCSAAQAPCRPPRRGPRAHCRHCCCAPCPRAVNTAINGNLVVKRREETTIRISDILDDVVANTKAIDKMKENAYL